MSQKILHIIIGALLGLIVFIGAIIIGTKTVGVPAAVFVELLLLVILAIFTHKKLAKKPTALYVSLGFFYSSIAYFVLMLLATVAMIFLLQGLTSGSPM